MHTTLGCVLLHRLCRPLTIPRQMRHDAEQALDDHQLSPVVNLMLLAADQHLEATFAPGTGLSACYDLDRPRFGELLDPIAPVVHPRRAAAARISALGSEHFSLVGSPAKNPRKSKPSIEVRFAPRECEDRTASSKPCEEGFRAQNGCPASGGSRTALQVCPRQSQSCSCGRLRILSASCLGSYRFIVSNVSCKVILPRSIAAFPTSLVHPLPSPALSEDHSQ